MKYAGRHLTSQSATAVHHRAFFFHTKNVMTYPCVPVHTNATTLLPTSDWASPGEELDLGNIFDPPAKKGGGAKDAAPDRMGVDGGGDAADSIPPLQAETGSEDGGKRDGDLDWISTGDPDEESCLDHTVSSDEDSDENDSNSINASKRRHPEKLADVSHCNMTG